MVKWHHMTDITDILKELLEGKISLDSAENLIKATYIEHVGDLAKLDVCRKARKGIPEVVFGEKKDLHALLEIVKAFLKVNKYAIISRVREDQNEIIRKTFKTTNYDIDVNEQAKIIIVKEKSFEFPLCGGKVGIITAGTSDIPIAEEARTIAKAMGCEIFTSFDVGIAGIHRIFDPLMDMIKKGVHVIIVCAGMEGTLPGVVAALVDVPVIGVPVSSGYGLGEKGKGALITMLQSCSPGLLVVNIDNGFGAGASAALIANKIAK